MLQLFHTLLGIGKLFLEHFSHIFILLLFQHGKAVLNGFFIFLIFLIGIHNWLQVALFLHKLLETIWIRCYIWLTQLIQNFLETYEQIVQLVKHGFPPVMFFSLLI